MNFKVEILFPGFSGKLTCGVLGWGSWALIKTADKNILFDAGGPAVRGRVPEVFKEHNLKPEDIDMVIASHLHFDHIYNLDFFPQAEFLLTKKEWEYASDMDKHDRYVDEKAILLLRSYKMKLLRKDGEEILPGMSYIMTPGHTPGGLSLVLDQGAEGKWILAGDAVKNRGELRSLQVQMSLNQKQSEESIKRIRSMADRVLPGHDGWLTVRGDDVIPEGRNDMTMLFGQGVTVNGGKTRIDLSMD